MPLSQIVSFGANRRFAESFSGAQVRFAQWLAQFTVISLLCISILAPFVSFTPALPWFRAEVLLLPPILLVYLWLVMAGYARTVRFNGMLLVGAVYAICILISMWFGAALLGQTLVLQDFYEFPKVVLPVAFFVVAYEANLSEVALRRLIRALGIVLTLICIYAWAQWMNLGFSQWLDGFYTAGKHVDDSLAYAHRVYSTMGNPNVLAQLLTWSIGVFLLGFVLRIGNRAVVVLLLLACLITLGMTGSRYGLLNTAFVLLLVMLMPFSARRRSKLALAAVLLPLFASAIFIVAINNPKTLERFQTLKDPVATDSASDRFDKLWLDAFDDFSQSPILGRGPTKTIFSGIVTDSEYLDVLKEFGILGFLAYLAYYLFPLLLIWRGMRAGIMGGARLEAQLPANYLAMRLGFVMIVTALLMNIGMSTFYNQLLQAFLWLWMGLGARAAKTIGDATAARGTLLRAIQLPSAP